MADYRLVVQQKDADAGITDRALETVREFLAEKALVLYGGLAIDYALRLKGASIYPENERPDFDMLSPDSVEDAYCLADLLHSQGFPNVSVVRGIHVQTMRVRVDFIPVADLSYCPEEVYRRLPTLVYRGLRVLHPDRQRCDIHLAFCFPFNNPPREDVFHRFAKDLSRLNILSTHYPITAPVEAPAPATVRRAITFRPELCAVHGFAAYALLRKALVAMAAPKKASQIPSMHVGVETNADGTVRLEVELPAACPEIVLVSPTPEAVFPGASSTTAYEPYMDARPVVYETEIEGGRVQVYSTRFRLLAVSVPEEPIQIVCAHYLLLYFLHQAQVSVDDNQNLYAHFYVATLNILAAAERALLKYKNDADFAKLWNSSPFGLTTRVLGQHNYNAAYCIQLAADVARSGVALPEDSPLRGHLPATEALPVNYYPARTKKHPEFVYENSPVFCHDGRRRGAVAV